MDQSPIRTPPHERVYPSYYSTSVSRHHQQSHYQSPGQETTDTTHPSTSNPSTEDADYKTVNHLLGQLHQQRLERETTIHHATSNDHDTSTKQSSTSHYPYQTPPPRQRRQVKHLYTNSKLG